MQYRALGQSGLRVAPLALGGNVFGWTADEKTSFRLLDAFLDGGGNLVDTADGYPHWAPGCQGGESEAVIGKWLKQGGKRDHVLIATKVGKWKQRPGLTRANITKAVDEQLRRLNTDCIDLYQAHADDADTPLEETLGAFDDLIRAGKVRAIGASNYTTARLREALAVSEANGWARYESIQPLYNLARRDEYEGVMQTLVCDEGLGVIPFFSLAAGFLTGKYRSRDDLSERARAGMVEGYLNDAGWALLAAMDRVAARHQANPTQVALAWLMAQPGITAPIASATSIAQLDDLLAAMHLSLDGEDHQLLGERAG